MPEKLYPFLSWTPNAGNEAAVFHEINGGLLIFF